MLTNSMHEQYIIVVLITALFIRSIESKREKYNLENALNMLVKVEFEFRQLLFITIF